MADIIHNSCLMPAPPPLLCLPLPTPLRYPTQLTLPDDRVLIIGGYYSLYGPTNLWAEVFNPIDSSLVSWLQIPFTTASDL